MIRQLLHRRVLQPIHLPRLLDGLDRREGVVELSAWLTDIVESARRRISLCARDASWARWSSRRVNPPIPCWPVDFAARHLSCDVGNAAFDDRVDAALAPIVEQERVELQDGMFRRREVAAEVRTRATAVLIRCRSCDVAAHFGADRNHDAVVGVHRFDHRARHRLPDAALATCVRRAPREAVVLR